MLRHQVRWATGKRLTDYLPKLSLTALSFSHTTFCINCHSYRRSHLLREWFLFLQTLPITFFTENRKTDVLCLIQYLDPIQFKTENGNFDVLRTIIFSLKTENNVTKLNARTKNYLRTYLWYALHRCCTLLLLIV